MGIETETPSRAPQQVRAVFSTEDFALLRVAVAHYIGSAVNSENRTKYGNLYHRLGRLS